MWGTTFTENDKINTEIIYYTFKTIFTQSRYRLYFHITGKCQYYKWIVLTRCSNVRKRVSVSNYNWFRALIVISSPLTITIESSETFYVYPLSHFNNCFSIMLCNLRSSYWEQLHDSRFACNIKIAILLWLRLNLWVSHDWNDFLSL